MSALEWFVSVAWLATVGWILVALQRDGWGEGESDWQGGHDDRLSRPGADDDDDDGPWGV